MSIDLRRFHRFYFAEASERLVSLERALRAFDCAAPDFSRIDDAVREAHSIKGGGDSLGFPRVSEVARVLEAALGEARGSAAPLAPASLASFLEMCAILRVRLDEQVRREFSDGMPPADQPRG